MAVPFTLAQSGSGHNATATTVAATWGNNTTSSNMIFVVVGTALSTVTVSSITDSQNNVYTKINSATSSVIDGELWYARQISGGVTPTVTATLSGLAAADMVMNEWSGLGFNTTVDEHTSNNAISGSVTSGASSITSQNTELVIGWGVVTGTTALTVGVGYSNLTNSQTNVAVGIESKIITTTGAQTATFGGGGGSNFVCGVATFFAGSNTNPNPASRPYPFSPGLAL